MPARRGTKTMRFLRLPLTVLFLATTLSIARAEDVQINANVVSAIDATKSSFTADPAEVPADGASLITLAVTVRNAANTPLPNKTVTITSSRGSTIDLIRCYDGPVLTTFNHTKTDSNGQAVCLISSTTPGETTLTATAETVELASKPTVEFTEVVSPPGSPPPTPPGQPKPPSPIEKIITDLGKALDTIPPAVPGGLGLAVLVPTIGLLVPLGSSFSIAIMAGIPAAQYLLLNAFPGLRPPRRWGLVRDASTNVPLPGIFVDLIEATTNVRIKRIMTDRFGRFGFLTPKQGQFYVQIANPLYQGFRTDVFEAAAWQDKPISFDILLKPIEAIRIAGLKKAARYMHFFAFVQGLQLFLLISGSLVSALLFIRNQNVETMLLVALYVMLWVLRMISSLGYRQSGHIIEGETHNSINEAVVQVTSTRKGEEQFIHSTLTDESGRFLILVPPGTYSVIAAKEGFQPSSKKVAGEVQSVEMDLHRTEELTGSLPIQATA